MNISIWLTYRHHTKKTFSLWGSELHVYIGKYVVCTTVKLPVCFTSKKCNFVHYFFDLFVVVVVVCLFYYWFFGKMGFLLFFCWGK